MPKNQHKKQQNYQYKVKGCKPESDNEKMQENKKDNLNVSPKQEKEEKDEVASQATQATSHLDNQEVIDRCDTPPKLKQQEVIYDNQQSNKVV